MISLKNILSKTKWEGREIELGKVYTNPYATAFKPMNEGEGEDHEVSMAQNQLDSIIKAATELKSKIGENEKNIPAWIQDHITNSENYINQAASNYHEYKEGVNEAPAQNTGEKIQRLNDRIRVLRAKITAQKDAVKRNELQQTLKNALQSLSNIKSAHGIKSESVNEAKKYDIGAGYMGNGLTIWNRAEQEHGDYRIIAHIDNYGKISIRDKQIPSNVMKMIEDWATAMKKGDK